MVHDDEEFGEGENEDTLPVNMERISAQELQTPVHHKSNSNSLKQSR
jgi:hypothetical protein